MRIMKNMGLRFTINRAVYAAQRHVGFIRRGGLR